MTTSNSQLEQRIQALEDEVSILKTEIRQILIDMRDTWLRKSDVLATSQHLVQPVASTPVPSPSAAPTVSNGVPRTYFGSEAGLDLSTDQNNKGTLNDLLAWMGEAKEKGLTAARLFPILEAYENSAMISPLMSKFILKNMSMLDEMYSGNDPMSPAVYSQVISDLHKLVCISIEAS
ncbi:MAG: hypothetical protein ACJ0BC_04210 [Dehalococcoidia bacterium]|jgi:hypothetical protein|nr:MAG: hypothetical protein EGP12_09675 [SAR202 cluster bacterium]|tara:strand:- start:333 stop:863 length:531 start_codon:yes stop_codon:yes gene_type:complete